MALRKWWHEVLAREHPVVAAARARADMALSRRRERDAVLHELQGIRAALEGIQSALEKPPAGTVGPARPGGGS